MQGYFQQALFDRKVQFLRIQIVNFVVPLLLGSIFAGSGEGVTIFLSFLPNYHWKHY